MRNHSSKHHRRETCVSCLETVVVPKSCRCLGLRFVVPRVLMYMLVPLPSCHRINFLERSGGPTNVPINNIQHEWRCKRGHTFWNTPNNVRRAEGGRRVATFCKVRLRLLLLLLVVLPVLLLVLSHRHCCCRALHLFFRTRRRAAPKDRGPFKFVRARYGSRVSCRFLRPS